MQQTSNKNTRQGVSNTILLQRHVGKAVLEFFTQYDPNLLSISIQEVAKQARKQKLFKGRSKAERRVFLHEAEELQEFLYELHLLIREYDTKRLQFQEQSILNSTRVKEFLASIVN